MAVYPDIKIGANWDNEAGSNAFEDITPSGDQAFYPPRELNYSPGQPVIRANGLVTFEGYDSYQWVWNLITRPQVRYLQTQFCSNGYSGKVTVRAEADTPGTYSNYNAVLILPTLAQIERDFRFYRDYAVNVVLHAST